MTTHLRPVPRSKSGWSCTSTPPMRLHGVVLGWGNIGATLPLPLEGSLRSNEPPIVMIPEVRFPWIQRLWCKADSSLLDSAEVWMLLPRTPDFCLLYYHVCNSPSLVPIPSQMNPTNNFPAYFRKIIFNISFLSMPRASIWLLHHNYWKKITKSVSLKLYQHPTAHRSVNSLMQNVCMW
jgi:hypothetical protein